MKKLFVCFAVAAASVVAPAYAQTRAKPASSGAGTAAAAAPAASAHQVGLIDMAYVFKNYAKFKSMTEEMQAEAKGAQAEAEAMVEEMKQIQGKMQTLQDGSDDFIANEKKLLTLNTNLESFRKIQQREFLRKEAEIYKTVYMEVQENVQRYAKHYGYTLIIRFNRQSVDAAENPQEIITSMNRQVVFYREQDDLTDPILDYLNKQYGEASGGSAAPPAKEARRSSGTTK